MPTPSDLLASLDVLVVDDEPDIKELIGEYLQTRGLRVTLASDGSEALSWIKREPTRFHLVVTDLQLPGPDGLDILRASKAANPSCVVVIVTGYASLDSAIQAVRLGAYDYLTKPFSLGQLDVLLGRLQDRLMLERENRRLLQQLGQRLEGEGRSAVAARLDAIESRLARIEHLLRENGEKRP